MGSRAVFEYLSIGLLCRFTSNHVVHRVQVLRTGSGTRRRVRWLPRKTYMTMTGVFAPIPTPFTESGELDLSGWRRNVERWMSTPLHGVVVLGTNGEAPLVDDAEADQLIEAARARVPSDRRLIAGTGRQSTRATISASKRAAAAGADAVLVRTPSVFKSQLTTSAFITHYSAVADASPVPVILYNFTAFTGLTLPVQAVATLATHGNIIGIKESGPDMSYVGDLVETASAEFSVLVGSAPTFFTSLMLGAQGGVLALASVAPEACVQIYELVLAGRHKEARALQRHVIPLAKLITSVYGIPGLKAALAEVGYVGGVPRPPLSPATDTAISQIRQAIERLTLHTDTVI